MLDVGYTKVPNILFQAATRLSQNELRVLLNILRHTYGFQRTQTEVSSRAIAQWAGINHPEVIKALRKLRDKGLIELSCSNRYIITVEERKLRIACLQLLDGQEEA